MQYCDIGGKLGVCSTVTSAGSLVGAVLLPLQKILIQVQACVTYIMVKRFTQSTPHPDAYVTIVRRPDITVLVDWA